MFGGAERTEPVTPRRRQVLRERGVVARSATVTAVASLLGAMGALWCVGGALLGEIGATFALDADPLSVHAEELVSRMVSAALRPFALIAVVGFGGVVGAIVGSAVQTGFVWSPAALAPNWQRLNPVAALGGMFSGLRVLQLAVHVIGVALALAWTGRCMAGDWEGWQSLGGASAAQLVAALGERIGSLVLGLWACFAVVGVLEYAVARWRYACETKLTQEEHRDELRETEGDPQLRPRRRSFYARMIRRGTPTPLPHAVTSDTTGERGALAP